MNLNKEYTNQMDWYDRGWVPYHPLQSGVIRIGNFGHFNQNGYWNRMGNFKDGASITRLNLKAFNVSLLDKASPITLEWSLLHAR